NNVTGNEMAAAIPARTGNRSKNSNDRRCAASQAVNIENLRIRGRRSLAHCHAVAQLIIPRGDNLEHGVEPARDLSQLFRLDAGFDIDTLSLPVYHLK